MFENCKLIRPIFLSTPSYNVSSCIIFLTELLQGAGEGEPVSGCQFLYALVYHNYCYHHSRLLSQFNLTSMSTELLAMPGKSYQIEAILGVN